MSASVSIFQPSAQRALCLARAAAGKQTLDTDVLVQIRPVNTFALPDESPMRAFGLVPMRQARVPRQWDTDAPAVDEIDNKGVIRCGGYRRPTQDQVERSAENAASSRLTAVENTQHHEPIAVVAILENVRAPNTSSTICRYSSRVESGRPSFGCRERTCALAMICCATIAASSGDWS